jgi:hypothetical protein
MHDLLHTANCQRTFSELLIGQHCKLPVVNEEILEWQETKELLAQHKIEITEEN